MIHPYYEKKHKLGAGQMRLFSLLLLVGYIGTAALATGI
jgi:hypothetical protein